MLLSGAVYEPLTLRPTLNGRFPAILKYGEDVITSQKHMRILKKPVLIRTGFFRDPDLVDYCEAGQHFSPPVQRGIIQEGSCGRMPCFHFDQ